MTFVQIIGRAHYAIVSQRALICQYPPDTLYEDVLVLLKRAQESSGIRQIAQVTLKNGPRAYKTASLLEVMNKQTGEVHHYTMVLEQIKYTKKEGWEYQSKNKITLEDKEGQEIHDLFVFLNAHFSGELKDTVGKVRVMSEEAYSKYESLIKAVPDLEDTERFDLLRNLLGHVEGGNRGQIQTLFSDTSPATLQHIAAASRMVEYKVAYEELERLVNDSNVKEIDFQRQLDANPWMFGSEYSELMSRRKWTRDEQLDYMLRRTVDDYVEIVEIKTAFPDDLFKYDKSHDSYYPSPKLSQAIGQVMKYIEEVERNRDAILAKDGIDTLKIRVRVIVGRDGNKAQQEALRNFNSHLHRIEVITYDQLLRIAERVLSMFQEHVPTEAESEEFDPDIPF